MPDGLAAQHAYAVLTQVLGQRQKWAVGRVVLGGHRVLALVRPCAQLLALHVLHFPEQLRSAEALPPLSQPDQASPEEQHLAGLLIDAATKSIPWSDYRDDTAELLFRDITRRGGGSIPPRNGHGEIICGIETR